MLANFIRLGVEGQHANTRSAESGPKTSADVAAAGAVANGVTAKGKPSGGVDVIRSMGCLAGLHNALPQGI